MELTECNAFDRFLNSTSTITSMVTKAMITTMSTTTTAMALVATLEPPSPPPMGCAVVASGLLVVSYNVFSTVSSSTDYIKTVGNDTTCSVIRVKHTRSKNITSLHGYWLW